MGTTGINGPVDTSGSGSVMGQIGDVLSGKTLSDYANVASSAAQAIANGTIGALGEDIAQIESKIGSGLQTAAVYVGFLLIIVVCVYVIVQEEG